jgi:hypothetical protein
MMEEGAFSKTSRAQLLATDKFQGNLLVLCLLLVYRREPPIGDSLFMRAAGAVFPKYAQTPQKLGHPVNERKFDHHSQ